MNHKRVLGLTIALEAGILLGACGQSGPTSTPVLPTDTPTGTPTHTPSYTPTATPTDTPTTTPTPTPTFTPTATPTDTPTHTPTPTPPPTFTPSPTPTSTPIPGIGTPLVVRGIQLRLTSARQQESYESVAQTFRPMNPQDILLIVEGKVVSGELEGVRDWKEVWLLDENGRKDVPGITISGTIDGEPNKVIWLFAVAKTSRSFTLHLPDGHTVNLAPLLGGETGTAPSPLPGAGLPPPLEPFVCPAPHVDDFSSAAGFGAGEAGFAQWGVIAGEYHLVMRQADSWLWRSDGTKVSDAIFEVDVRQAAAGSGAYGLVFGADSLADGQQFHAFVLSSDGHYGLFRHTRAGEWVEVEEFTHSPFLYTGSESNHLMIVRSGPLIGLYANGIPLTAAIYDPTYAGMRYAGLVAWSNETAGLEARFDEFTVCPLSQPYPLPVSPFAGETLRWSVNQPVVLHWTWSATTGSLAQSFADLSDTTVIVDGQEFTGLREYWSAPAP